MDVSKVLYDKLFIRGDSMKTITAYEYQVSSFMNWVDKSPLKVRQSDVESYVKFMRSSGYAHSSINQAIAAIKFFFNEIMNRRFQVKSLKKQERHTRVCSADEIMEAVDNLKNDKHRLFLILLYGSGLRVSEAVNLRHEDIFDDSILIRQGKGAKDRLAIISKRFLFEYENFKGKKGFVFKGRNGHLTVRSAQEIVKNAFKDKHVHPHMMRASFATHLMESGLNPSVIQRFTGHKNAKTLSIYTTYAKINPKNYVSPMDIGQSDNLINKVFPL